MLVQASDPATLTVARDGFQNSSRAESGSNTHPMPDRVHASPNLPALQSIMHCPVRYVDLLSTSSRVRCAALGPADDSPKAASKP